MMRVTLLALALAAAAAPLAAQPPAARGDSATLRTIVEIGTRRPSPLDSNLRHLTDVIGPRLTGSAGMRRASEWAAAKLRQYGADRVWEETYPFGRGWERGPTVMRLVEPHEQWLVGAALGWSAPTNGPVNGEVVFMDARTAADFRARFAGGLAGAWVLLRVPLPMYDRWAPSAADSARVRAGQAAIYGRPSIPEEHAFLRVLDSALAAERVAGEIRTSDKDRGLLSAAGFPHDVKPYPVVVVAHETFAHLHRLLAAGIRPRVEIDARSRLTQETTAVNTLGEIRGSTAPDEIILLGAHLDSEDLATGATDNGAGAVAVIEALRILKDSGVRPRRTIRFALFSGEEQGLLGSTAYVMTHAREIPRHQAVMVMDNGSGRITGLPLQGRNDLGPLMTRLLAPLSELGPFEVQARTRGGSDHLPFLRNGVFAFIFNQDWKSYDWTWHTQVDAYDHVIPADVRQAATVMAALAYQLANVPERLTTRQD